ncbi:MAG: class I SAM-dependent methyltransferase [Anaerolineales bacterium]
MNSTTTAQLLDVNKSFYQTFAEQFSATRRRLQPGVQRILEKFSSQAHILDLGCGHGELALSLSRSGHQGIYVGIDLSSHLLERARQLVARQNFSAHFIQADLSTPGWENQLPILAFDIILAFAVLHHLPGNPLRLQVLSSSHHLLSPDGRFIHSVWQFLSSPRMRSRIQPWETIGLSDEDVDPGDYLLDWRHGGLGYRYVHHYSTAELASLAAATGFSIQDTFISDGENGKLGLYQVWTKTRN